MRHLLAELALNARILIRQPGFWVPAVLFPAMLYAFFGAQQSRGFEVYALASFAVYAVVGVGFYQFGVSVAQDRETPFTAWARTLPGPAWPGWAARVAATLAFVLLAVALVLVAGWLVAGVALAPAAVARLVDTCAFGAVPAVLMGIALGSMVSARAAAAMANLVFLPLAYLGGLWVPPVALPAGVAAISVWTPTRALGELAWAAVDGRAWPGRSLLVLAAWALAALAILAVSQRRHRQARFG